MNKSKSKRHKDDHTNKKITQFMKKSTATEKSKHDAKLTAAGTSSTAMSGKTAAEFCPPAGSSTTATMKTEKPASKVQKALEDVFGYKHFKTDLQRRATEAGAKGKFKAILRDVIPWDGRGKNLLFNFFHHTV